MVHISLSRPTPNQRLCEYVYSAEQKYTVGEEVNRRSYVLTATRYHPVRSGRMDFEFGRYSRIPAFVPVESASLSATIRKYTGQIGAPNRTCPPSSLLKFPLRLRLIRNRQKGLPWKLDSRNGFHLHQGAGPLLRVN